MIVNNNSSRNYISRNLIEESIDYIFKGVLTIDITNNNLNNFSYLNYHKDINETMNIDEALSFVDRKDYKFDSFVNIFNFGCNTKEDLIKILRKCKK